MIAGIVRHAKTLRDARALVAHLLKQENAPKVHIHGGTLAQDLSSALSDMQRLRDATSADSAALHIHLSPSRSMSDDELVRAAEIVIEHFEAQECPAALVIHQKDRLDGDGNRHAHLVLGRVSPDLQVLQSGYEIIRLETAARLIEHELGEAPTLGRHHKSALKWLKANGREDVANWLEKAFGAEPNKPQSTASPDSRQGLARQGIDLSKARAEIRHAWETNGPAGVQEAGYEIAAGRKPGVFIVSQKGIEIGALDRLLGEKRALVRTAMEAPNAQFLAKTAGWDKTQCSQKPAECGSEPSVEHQSPENGSHKSSGETAAISLETGANAAARSIGVKGNNRPSDAELVSEAAAKAARQFARLVEANRNPKRSVSGHEEKTDDQSDIIVRTPNTAKEAEWEAGLRAVRAAHRFLDRQEAELLESVSDLALADHLPDPDELIQAKKSLQAAAKNLGHWDQENGPQLRAFNHQFEMPRPRGFWSWITGKTRRWRQTKDKRRNLLEARAPLLAAVNKRRRIVQILRTTQESRQILHTQKRLRQLERHQDVLDLIPHARAVLRDNPDIAIGGSKALARAARQRHLVLERQRRLQLEPETIAKFTPVGGS